MKTRTENSRERDTDLEREREKFGTQNLLFFFLNF